MTASVKTVHIWQPVTARYDLPSNDLILSLRDTVFGETVEYALERLQAYYEQTRMAYDCSKAQKRTLWVYGRYSIDDVAAALEWLEVEIAGIVREKLTDAKT